MRLDGHLVSRDMGEARRSTRGRLDMQAFGPQLKSTRLAQHGGGGGGGGVGTIVQTSRRGRPLSENGVPCAWGRRGGGGAWCRPLSNLIARGGLAKRGRPLSNPL